MSIVLAGAVLAVSLFAGEPATIDDLAVSSEASSNAHKQLVVCERDEASRRAFRREHGAVAFVSANEVIRSRGDGRPWAAPKCITPAEYIKLRRLTPLGYAQPTRR